MVSFYSIVIVSASDPIYEEVPDAVMDATTSVETVVVADSMATWQHKPKDLAGSS